MSFLRRRADAPLEAVPEAPPVAVADDTAPAEPAVPARRLSRAERKAQKAQKAEQAVAAERAARIARAQRRLAQATGPLPVVPQRRPSEDAVPTE